MTYISKSNTFRFSLAVASIIALSFNTIVFAGGGAGGGGGGSTSNTSFGGTSTSVRGSFTTDRAVAGAIASGANAMTSASNQAQNGSWGVQSTYSSTGGWGYSVGRTGPQSGGGNGNGNSFTPIRTTTPGGGTPGGGTPTPPPPTPPTLSLVAEVNDARNYNANTTIRVAPSDKIDLSWNSSGATTCTNNFGGSGLNNTSTFNPNAIMPGTSRLFQMSCTGVGGNIARTVTAAVPGITIQLTADRSLVRYGETVTYSWTIALSSPLSSGPSTTPYPMSCVISGGATRTFNASTQPTGSITSEALTNSRQTTLTCTETAAGTGYRVSNSTIVEIIPRSEET